MKNFIDVVPFLQSYADWVRWLVVFWLLYTASLGGVLLFAGRKVAAEPKVALDDFRLAADSAHSGLILDLLVRNPMPQTAQLVELRLVFYGEQKPRGGLQSFASESAIYVIADSAAINGLSAGEVQDKFRYQTKINYPFAGQDYAEVSIPLSQSVEKGKTDRFVVRFETKQLPKVGHHNIEATIRYNGDKLTEARMVALQNYTQRQIN